jgi:hypothetical protein
MYILELTTLLTNFKELSDTVNVLSEIGIITSDITSSESSNIKYYK